MSDILSATLRATCSRPNLPSMVICDVRHWQVPALIQKKGSRMSRNDAISLSNQINL